MAISSIQSHVAESSPLLSNTGQSNAAPLTPTQSESTGGIVAKETGTADAESFSDLVQGLLQRANQPHLDADEALQQLMTGETNNVHGVVMSVAKADLSFRFMLELRNRLTEAYQEVMRMQV